MLKVLVVDDEEDFRDPIASFLARTGYEAKTAPSGEEARMVADAFKPDLLITDWRLAGQLNGASLIHALLPDHPNLRIIVITGYSAQDIEESLAGYRVSAIIEKPLDLDTLRQAIKNALAGPA